MTDELAEALAARYDEPPLGTEEAEQWRITDDSQAAWALRRLAWYEAERDRMVDRAEEERAAIEAWLADATSGVRGKIEFFREHLEGYYRQLVATKGREVPQTYRLPGGALKRRKAPDSLVVRNETDEQAFIAWCLAEGRTEYLSIKVDRQAVKDSVKIGYLRLEPPIEKDGRSTAPIEYGTEHAVEVPCVKCDEFGTVDPAAAGYDRPLCPWCGGDKSNPMPGIVWRVGDEGYSVEVKP